MRGKKVTLRSPAGRALTWLLALYGIASLLHFAHNAEHLARYPNLPGWLSRGQIYSAWVLVTVVGAAGYVLHQRGLQRIGLIVLAVYAAIGFDGLLHYSRAPFATHTTGMNASIWFEAVAAALLLAAVAIRAIRLRSRQWQPMP